MNEEHVHDLAYTVGENPGVFCVDFRCGFGLSEKEVFARLNEYETLKKGAWWKRMSNEGIAAELSATFDLGLKITRKIATWILTEESGK